MRRYLLALILIAAGFLKTIAQPTYANLPHLVKNGSNVQLWVDGHPFLILGGELGNSSASSMQYMRPLWPKFKKMNLNTVFAPVYWELIEPQQGKFNFKLLDDLITGARQNNFKLVLLWFGSWKNSMSCYAPEWVKTNSARFPRAKAKSGVAQEILTPFNINNLEADKNAYVKLLTHLKAFDSKYHTVIMIQVENEIGMLPDARSYDAEANKAFDQPVPAQLLNHFVANKDKLLPETKQIWATNGNQASGNWEAVFGKSLATDELFMAWHYAQYVDKIAAAGKKAYNLPTYVNAALNRPGKKPGEYPSAGPLPQVMDVWKIGAPGIDIMAPDFYNPDFEHWCDLFTRAQNPLFIPEIRFEAGVDAKAFFVFGNYHAISFSPFSLEDTNKPEKEPLGKAYHILRQLTPLITKYQATGAIKGFLFDQDSSVHKTTLGNYNLNVSHEYRLGWAPEAKNGKWPETGAIVISVGPGEYYVAGTGVVITFDPLTNGRAGFISVDEGSFENGHWVPQRRMNGDQDHQGRHVRIAVNDYSIQHVKLYTY